ncbi:MAG: thiamine phosphate synthase [Pseudomonadota bacterium]
MADDEQPQIYLISPPSIELSQFPDALARVLDSRAIACVRLALSTTDEDAQSRAADLCREVCHARDVAIVVENHLRLAETLGLDGVHFSDGPRQVRPARQDLGEDAIVGAHCRTSRHDGMTAGEAGADYVAFGPVEAGLLGDGSAAEKDLFAWWSEMIELPVVAEGGLTADSIADLAPVTDFFGIGMEIWSKENPVTALQDLLAPLT